MWAAGFSDSNVNDGCTFAQQARAILDTGSPCSGGPLLRASATPTYTATVLPTVKTVPTEPATPLTPSIPSTPPQPESTEPAAAGPVPQWIQVSQAPSTPDRPVLSGRHRANVATLVRWNRLYGINGVPGSLQMRVDRYMVVALCVGKSSPLGESFSVDIIRSEVAVMD